MHLTTKTIGIRGLEELSKNSFITQMLYTLWNTFILTLRRKNVTSRSRQQKLQHTKNLHNDHLVHEKMESKN